jgi:hypothetical protein
MAFIAAAASPDATRRYRHLMPHEVKQRLLTDLRQQFASVRKLPNSQSLFELGGRERIYIRYSKLHPDGRTFYGLRKTDIQQLEGHESLICFLWDGQHDPLLVPFRDFEEIFAGLTPASDGQFKAQVYPAISGTELYIANAGRFNVESFFGWNETNSISSAASEHWNRDLTHSQVQTLLGAIGARKGHDIWLPRGDRGRMDWTLCAQFQFSQDSFASRDFERVASTIDVIWIRKGSRDVTALFEVEHSTPIYSGLLRFNDVRLTIPMMQPRFAIVANDARRSRFSAQINRPTFKSSGLSELCTFLDYANVFEWHKRVSGEKIDEI